MSSLIRIRNHVTSTPIVFDKIEITLLDSMTTITSGEWINNLDFTRVSIHVKGIVTAVLQLRGSNAPIKLNDIDDEIQIGSDITTDQILFYEVPIKWIKMKINSYTAGTISAYLVGE